MESVYQIGYFPRHGSLRGVGSSRWKNIVAPGQRRRPETSVFRDWIALFEYSRIEKCSISAGKKWLDTFNSCFLLFRFKHVISPVYEGSFKKHPCIILSINSTAFISIFEFHIYYSNLPEIFFQAECTYIENRSQALLILLITFLIFYEIYVWIFSTLTLFS